MTRSAALSAALLLCALAPRVDAQGAAVMNAATCNRSDTNQQWLVNATHGAAHHQLTVEAQAADAEERCAALRVSAADCSVQDFAFVSTDGCAPACCADAQGFDLVDAKTKQPAPAGKPCADCVIRSRLNSSLCFGVGAELGGVSWKVSAVAGGKSLLEMIGSFGPLCLSSGFESDPYPISLQTCEY